MYQFNSLDGAMLATLALNIDLMETFW